MDSQVFLLVLLSLTCSFMLSSHASPLLDFCVPTPNSQGKLCKDLKLVDADDFFFTGTHNSGNTSNPFGATVTPFTVAQIPGLNTLGIAMARLDFAPGGMVTPHIHQRATEMLTVLEGTLSVGFITSFPENRFIYKILQKGDGFIFPQGLVHFQVNVGKTNALAMVGLSNDNPGRININDNTFGTNPPINADVLAKVYQVDKSVVDYLQTQF